MSSLLNGKALNRLVSENIKRIIEHAQHIDVQPEDIQNVETKLFLHFLLYVNFCDRKSK